MKTGKRGKPHSEALLVIFLTIGTIGTIGNVSKTTPYTTHDWECLYLYQLYKKW